MDWVERQPWEVKGIPIEYERQPCKPLPALVEGLTPKDCVTGAMSSRLITARRSSLRSCPHRVAARPHRC